MLGLLVRLPEEAEAGSTCSTCKRRSLHKEGYYFRHDTRVDSMDGGNLSSGGMWLCHSELQSAVLGLPWAFAPIMYVKIHLGGGAYTMLPGGI